MALVLKSLTNLAHASARTSFLQATLLSSMLSPRRMSSVLSDDGRSRIQLGASDAEVEELIESNLDKSYRKKEDTSPLQVLTTRREALALYRDIWRNSLLFVWKDEKGRVWRDVLRENARKEFEEARYETDPEIINRLLVTGRDCVHQVRNKFLAQRQRIIEEEAQAAEQAQRERWRPPHES